MKLIELKREECSLHSGYRIDSKKYEKIILDSLIIFNKDFMFKFIDSNKIEQTDFSKYVENYFGYLCYLQLKEDSKYKLNIPLTNIEIDEAYKISIENQKEIKEKEYIRLKDKYISNYND